MSEAVTVTGVSLGPVIALAVLGVVVAQGAAAACVATQRFVWSALGTAGELLNEKLDAADGSLRGRSAGRRMRRLQPSVSFQTARTVLRDGDALERAARATGLTALRDVVLEQEDGESIPLDVCMIEDGEVRFALRKRQGRGLEALWVDGDTQARAALGRLVQRYQTAQAVAAARGEGFELIGKPKVTARGDLEIALRRRSQVEDTTLLITVEAGGRTHVESGSRDRASGRPGECPDMASVRKQLGVPVPINDDTAKRINLRPRGPRSTGGTAVERRFVEPPGRKGRRDDGK